MIPKNITRHNILAAIEHIDKEGVPIGRDSRKHKLVYNGRHYPPKLVVSLANSYANGEHLQPEQFGGGKETNTFLRSRGFRTIESGPPTTRRRRQGRMPVSRRTPKTRHDERCPECKRTIEEMLKAIYGDVRRDYKFQAGTLPSDYAASPFHGALRDLYAALQQLRGHARFIRTANLPRVDYFVPNPGFILEFDERQHFTTCRGESLRRYPAELKVRFDIDRWIDLCDTIRAKDNDPPYRDEQRAWYDTLRDFLPSMSSLQPTVRLCAKDVRWCDLKPERPLDRRKFRRLVEGSTPEFRVETRADHKASLARLIMSAGAVDKSRKGRLRVNLGEHVVPSPPQPLQKRRLWPILQAGGMAVKPANRLLVSPGPQLPNPGQGTSRQGVCSALSFSRL